MAQNPGVFEPTSAGTAAPARPEPFSAGSTYDKRLFYPPAYVIPGTNENRITLQNFNDTKSMEARVIGADIDGALAEKAAYDKNFLAYREKLETLKKLQSGNTGFGMMDSSVNSGPSIYGDLKEPTRSAYGSWLTSKGSNRDEIVSGLLREGEQSNFLIQRLVSEGVIDIIKEDPNAVRDAEYFSNILLQKGKITPEEKKYYMDSNTKYGRMFRTDLHSKVWQLAKNEGLVSEDYPTTYLDRLQSGIPLKPESKEDFEMFKAAKRMQRNPGFTDWVNNASNAASHLFGSVIDMLPSTLDALVHPDYTWADEWRNPSGENLQMKQEFVFELNKLIEAKKRNYTPNGEDFPSQIKSFKERHGTLSESDALRAFLDEKDPTGRKGIDGQAEKVVRLWKKLDSRGAFSGADNPMLAGGQNTLGTIFSVADGVLAATAGISYLATSTDPDSVITEFVGSQWTNTQDEYLFAMGAITWEDVEIRAQMRYVNAIQSLREGINYVITDGLFSQVSGAGSQRVRENASMFLDVWTAKAIYKNFGTLMGFGGVETLQAAGKGYSREQALEARLLAKDLVRKNGTVDGPSRILIDSVKDTAKAGGVTLDDYEAIERIVSGKGTWLNPATGKIEGITQPMIDALKVDLMNKSKGVAKVRRQLATLVKEGDKIIYSDKAYDILGRVRDRLKEIEPGLWDDASDFEIYQRTQAGSLDMPAGKTSRVNLNAAMIENLRKEVGKSWRKFSTRDLAGFKDLEALEELLMNMPGRGLTATASAAFKGLQKGLDKIAGETKRFALPTQGEVAAILAAGSDVDKAASMNITITSGGNWAAKWNESRKIWSIMNVSGYAGYFFEFWNDWLKASSLATTESRSVSGLLRKSYDSQLGEALGQLEKVQLGVKTGLNTKEEHAKLMARIERLTALKQSASLVNSLVEHGIGAGVYQMGNIMASSFVNEGLLWLGDTTMLGTATGYTFGSKSLNVMNRSLMRNVSPTYGMNERAVYDLMEISARMAEMDPNQAATVKQMLDTLVKRRDEKLKLPGSGVLKINQHILAQKEFATYVSVINRLLSGTNVEFHDPSVASGAMALYGSREFATAEIAQAAKDQFLLQAKELGLEGIEAENHAKRMVQQHTDSLAAEAAVGDIGVRLDKLSQLRKTLEQEGKDRITKFQQVAQIIADEAGVSIEGIKVEEPKTDIRGPYNGPGFIVEATGKDGKKIDITSNLSAATIKKINSFKDVWLSLSKDLAENKQAILDINSEVAQLEAKRTQLLPNISSARTARIGEFLTMDNGITIEKREAVILFHVPVPDGMGNMVSKTQIIIDKEAFLRPATSTTRPGVSIALEEIAHALFVSDALQTNRTTFMRHFLGKWELNENQEWEMRDGPTVAKTPEEAIEFMDMYAKSYAEGLGPEQGPVFLARWEHGKRQWTLNKADTRHMQDVFMEIWGKIYQMRQLVSNPQAAKTGATPQSFHGRWETSPIVAGNGNWKNFFKFAFGQTTIQDMITQNDADNLLAFYSRDIDESKMTHEEVENRRAEIARIEQRIASSNMWTDMFVLGGVYDKTMRSTVVSGLRKFGFKFENNESLDPAKFFSTTELWDETSGKYAPIHPSLQQTVDAAHAMTRGVPSHVTMNDNFMWEMIHKEEGLDTGEAKQRRILWAFATGRKEWLGKDGKFKAPISQLFREEQKPIETFKNVVVDTDPHGQIYGLSPFKDKKGNIVLSGTPNKEQATRLIEWLKTTGQYGSSSPFKMNQHHFDTIAKMLDGIGRSDILSPENAKNKTAGYVPVFLVDYAGVTHMTDTGKVIRGHQGIRRFAPISVVIDKTTLDTEGYKLKKKDKKGYLTNENMDPVDMLYFWVVDVDAWNDRSKASWEGLLKDNNDVRYEWSNAQMKNWFGNYNTFIEAQEKVLMNFSQGSTYQGKGTRFPPKRTWQVMLPYANGNQKLAMKMADVVLRSIGFPDTELGELVRLEASDAKKLSALDKERLAELKKKGIERDEAGQFFAALNAKNPNEFGSGPAWNSKMIFTKIRPDRVLGQIGRVLTKEGDPAMIPFSSSVYSWGQANYSTGNSWFNITNKEMSTLSSQFNMGEDRILSGARHASGYTLWLLERKNPAFHGVTEQRWVAFDPERRRVPGEFKLRQDAESASTKHSTDNPLSNSPQIGNMFETSMADAGFIPVGTTFEAGRRTEFISKDGVWTVRRNPATRRFDLIDSKSGLTIRTGMSLKGNQQGARTEVLLANIQDAIDSNSVEVALTEQRHAGLEASGIMEWKKVQTVNGQQKTRMFDKNPVYWAFKKHLRNVGDAAWANEIAQAMVTELGADVVESSPSKTIAWIQDFRKKGYFGWYFDNKVLKEGQKTYKQMLAEERDANARRVVPTEPTKSKPLGPKPPAYTNEEWLRMQAEIDAANIDVDLWNEGALEREQEIARHREGLKLALDWSDNMIQQYYKFIEAEKHGPAPTTSNAMEAAHFAETHAQTITALRKAGVATENLTYLNDYGYRIAQIAPKDIVDPSGFRVTMPSISGAIKNSLSGKDVKYRPNLFYVYSPRGMLVGSFRSFDDATKGANDDLLKVRNIDRLKAQVEASGPQPHEWKKNEKGEWRYLPR